MGILSSQTIVPLLIDPLDPLLVEPLVEPLEPLLVEPLEPPLVELVPRFNESSVPLHAARIALQAKKLAIGNKNRGVISRSIFMNGLLDISFSHVTLRDKHLNVAEEMHYVAVFHDVCFAFFSQFARLSRAGFTTKTNVIVIRDRFGTNESFFKIRVDFTS